VATDKKPQSDRLVPMKDFYPQFDFPVVGQFE
jgi:hypothetical protein